MKQYIVDAFADRVFEGNPAAVIVTDGPLEENLMTAIARENNLSETAFAFPEGDGWRLRWFTPAREIDLCGHATLATAFVIDRFVRPDGVRISFHTLSGTLTVERRGELYEMDFPAYTLRPVEVTGQIADALGVRPREVWKARDLLCIFDRAEDIVNMTPDMEKLKNLKGALMQVTAPGSGAFDCISRSFAPKMGVAEDPVCGSGHCHIIPYWAAQTGKTKFVARQASPRGGTLYCSLEGDRVKLAGRAVLYAQSELMVE